MLPGLAARGCARCEDAALQSSDGTAPRRRRRASGQLATIVREATIPPKQAPSRRRMPALAIAAARPVENLTAVTGNAELKDRSPMLVGNDGADDAAQPQAPSLPAPDAGAAARGWRESGARRCRRGHRGHHRRNASAVDGTEAAQPAHGADAGDVGHASAPPSKRPCRVVLDAFDAEPEACPGSVPLHDEPGAAAATAAPEQRGQAPPRAANGRNRGQ